MRTRPFTWDDIIVWEVQSGVYTSRFSPKPGDVVVDAGAHIGSFTVIASDLVGPAGRVHAFEPHPENMALLVENTLGRANVTRHTEALGSFLGTAMMPRVLEANTGVARLGDGDLPVKVAPLDFMVNRVDFLKVDVEGSELALLQGARRLISENAPKVVMEVDGWSPQPVVDELASLGYRVETTPYWLNTFIYAQK